MKKNKNIIAIIIIIILVVICLIPLFWIDISEFDKYKFTEEYYKFILYSIQLVCFGTVLSYMIKKNIEKNQNQIKQNDITNYLQKQRKNKNIIQNCIKNKNNIGLAEALRDFVNTSTFLSLIDTNEVARLEELNYSGKIKEEINYILDNIESKKITDHLMQQACSTVNNFLDRYER